MAQKHRGEGWTVELNDGVMVWEFLPGMELSAFEEEAYPIYEEMLTDNDIDGLVTVVKMDDAFNEAVFSVWERSAQRAEEAGIGRWAVVAEGIKSLSLRGKVNVGDLDTLTTENRTDAVEWAGQ